MSIRYTKSSNNLQLDSNIIPMAKPSQTDIDQMIQYARPTNRDLTRRDISRAINSLTSSLFLKVAPYTYNNGISKELLCLHGTVICHYRGNRYNIPIEIWLQQDHPNVSPLAYVKPTLDMYISPSSRDVQPDGTIVIPYLRSWRHPNSDLITLINAMSEAFSQSPPVYSSSSGTPRQTTYPSTSTSYPSTSTSYPTTSTSYPSSSTPYPTNPTPYSSIPTPYSM
jgi:ESCRT-I complex subunit TSG101